MISRTILLFLLFVLVVLASACIGEVHLSPAQLGELLMRGPGQLPPEVVDLLIMVRLPRMAAAAMVGAALAVSGYLMQSLSNNCLADPYITGVSSGAGLTAVIAMIVGLDFGLLPAVSLSGGMAAALVVALVARTPSGVSIHRLLLSGVALSALCGSMITLLLSMSRSDKTFGIMYWLAGTVTGRNWTELVPASVYLCLGFAVAVLMSKPLRLLSLGSAPAASLGVQVQRSQLIILSAAVLLCGTAVSISGLVGFVGMLAPYCARVLFGRDERLHLICSALIGAALVMLSDLVARSAPGQELPLGTLLSLLGGPFFLYQIMKQEDWRH